MLHDAFYPQRSSRIHRPSRFLLLVAHMANGSSRVLLLCRRVQQRQGEARLSSLIQARQEVLDESQALTRRCSGVQGGNSFEVFHLGPPRIVATMSPSLPDVYSLSQVLQHANVETFIVLRSTTPIVVAIADAIFRPHAAVFPSSKTWLSLVRAPTAAEGASCLLCFSVRPPGAP